MWVNTKEIGDVIGHDKARILMISMHNIYNRKVFKTKLKMGTCKHRNHFSNEVIDMTTVLKYIDIVHAIEMYEKLKIKRPRFTENYDKRIKDLTKVVKYYNKT